MDKTLRFATSIIYIVLKLSPHIKGRPPRFATSIIYIVLKPINDKELSQLVLLPA